MRGRPPTPPSSTPGPRLDEPQVNEHEVSSAVVDGPPLSVSRGSPELDATEINGQYVDRTSALSFLQRARSRLKQSKANSPGQADRYKQPLTAAGDKPLHGALPASSTGQFTILPSIPNEIEATELLDLYFDVCVATYKPLHRPTVDVWHRTVTSSLAQGLPMTEGLSNAKVSTLLSVFAVATFHRQKSRGFFDDASSLSSSDAFFKCAMAFTETETGVPQLESAQARLLQVFYLLMTSRMNQAWYIFGNLLQIISALGMHRRNRTNAAISSSQQNYIHLQCRIRTFWSAYILDKYLGVVMGRPRHFHDKDIDQDLPDRVDDTSMCPAGRALAEAEAAEAEAADESHVDGFLWNTKLACLVGEISDGLYPIKPLPESQRMQTAQRLATELENWHHSLPALLKANPSSLVRGFRRQCVALRLAYKHAVVHLHRPFLLGPALTQPSSDANPMHEFRRTSTKICISAARDALRTIDALAQEGPLFHAFWWTHYITFCVLTVTYVWNMQRETHELEGIDADALMALAERCHMHLANATTTNSPSRRYSIILDELRGEPRAQAPMASGATGLNDQALPSDAINTIPATDPSVMVNDTGYAGNPDVSSLDIQTMLMNWQASDWLELDASVSLAITSPTPPQELRTDFRTTGLRRGHRPQPGISVARADIEQSAPAPVP